MLIDMKYLGIDYGTKKVGLALTDEGGMMAFPHATVRNDEGLLTYISDLIAAEHVGAVVIGQSVGLDGTLNAVQQDIDAFMLELTLRTPTPIHLEPEQLTSRQAAALTGRSDDLDAAAAAIILDSYIQKQS
jgi:putative Holliday junction resolvase